MKAYDCYASDDEQERWHYEDMCGAIETALESHMLELLLPWAEYRTLRDWQPSKGMIITIGAGVREQVKWNDVAPDLEGQLHDQVFEQVGEVAEIVQYPDDLQDQFEAWLAKKINLNVFRVENITSLDLIYAGDENWLTAEEISPQIEQ